ncbi:hypothetical protein STEG23_005147, partial [Scotinomys teguina]
MKRRRRKDQDEKKIPFCVYKEMQPRRDAIPENQPSGVTEDPVPETLKEFQG